MGHVLAFVLFIFLGAPYGERLRGNRNLSAALTGITAAVVGVIANLAVYSAIHTLFGRVDDVRWAPAQFQWPDVVTFRPVQLGIAAVAAVMIFKLRWGILRVLGVCAVLGALATLTLP